MGENLTRLKLKAIPPDTTQTAEQESRSTKDYPKLGHTEVDLYQSLCHLCFSTPLISE